MGELPAGYLPVEGSDRTPLPGAERVGPADPRQRVTVSVRLRRRPDAPPLPHTRRGTGHLPRERFAALFGADPADIDQVAAFARQHGLDVGETSIARRTVQLTGTVAQLQAAFAVELGDYRAGQTSYRGREGHLHLPAGLLPIVEGVFGLDDRPQARPLFRTAVPREARKKKEDVEATTPPQVARLYDFPSGISAEGQCIALLEFGGGYAASDVHTWFNRHGIHPPRLSHVGIDGSGNSFGTDESSDTEVLLDIVVAGSVAEGARIALYFAPWTEQGWVDAVTTAIHDAANEPSVLSISWGWPELESFPGTNWTWTKSAMNAVSATFEEAAALGVTVLAASGDFGTDNRIGDGHTHMLYPGCDPYLTSCGGTTLKDISGTRFTEVLWSDSKSGASGGGVSAYFDPPPWQAGVGVPASVEDGHRGRGLPDIAGNADPESGYTLVLNGKDTDPVGGTSATAPLYAGLVALINAQLRIRLGYLNPALYELAESGIYRDVTCCGTNAFDDAPGYHVGKGWDATTGFGSVRGTALLDELTSDLFAALIPAMH
jgi:kumamolisin